MAKENTVYLYGRVKQPPRIYKNKAGQYVLGKIVVDTNRKSYATEELLLRGEIRRDSILVRTEHEEMIRDVYTLINEGDFVQIALIRHLHDLHSILPTVQPLLLCHNLLFPTLLLLQHLLCLLLMPRKDLLKH